jgi:Ca2+-binding RTX toxin-like protein
LVQAGPGCAQIDPQAAACTAGTIGTVQLGDSEDWFASSFGGGEVFGDEGRDVLQRRIGLMDGGEGDDVLVGDTGDGGAGDDVLVGATGDGGAGADLLLVNSGFGGSGDDALSCPPQGSCYLEGGPGDDLLTGGPGPDRLFGRRGDDVLRGGSDFDRLRGGLGDDLLAGAAGGDQMHGDAGADRLVSREDRSVGERRVLDRVDCGRGRRDLAVADRRDDVEESCERLALPD